MKKWKDYKGRIDWAGISITHVGKHYRNVSASSTCPLCRQLHAPWIEPFLKSRDPEKWKAKDSGDQLRMFLNLRHLPHVNDYPTARMVLRDHDAPCHIAVVPDGRKWRYALPKHLESKGMVIVMSKESHSLQLFVPLQVSEKFDPKVVFRWLKYCNRHKRCNPKVPAPEVRGMKVIDCHTKDLVIRDYRPGNKYVALSYVWGEPLTTETALSALIPERKTLTTHFVRAKLKVPPKLIRQPLQTTQTKFNFVQTKLQAKRAPAAPSRKPTFGLPKDIPLTIQDAIQVTKALGYQFLWVDKYCIDQKNKTERQQQCGRMGDIYAGSQITIFALGHDSNYGLPGVSLRHRSEQWQFRTTIGQYEFVSTPPDPQLSIQQSKWSTRGWTYQEGLFSTRRLFFTDHQVYFECNAMNCAESFKSNLAILHVLNGERFRAYHRAGKFVCGNSNPYSHVQVSRSKANHRKIDIIRRCQYQIHQYSRRELTKSHDILEAFAGIARFYAKTSALIFSLAGIPVPSPIVELRQNERNEQQRLNHLSYALAWIHDIQVVGGSSLEYDYKRSRKQSWPACEWSPLTPHENVKPQPRHGFPSWSWAGWIGGIRERKDLPYCWNSYLSSVRIGFSGDDLKDYTWLGEFKEDCKQCYIRQLLMVNVLYFDAYVLNPRKLKFWENGPDIPSGEIRSDTVRVYLSDGFCSWEELREKLIHEAYQCVVLGMYGKPDGAIFRAIQSADRKGAKAQKRRIDLIERWDREAIVCLLVEHVEGMSYRRVGLLNVRFEPSIDYFKSEHNGSREKRSFVLI